MPLMARALTQQGVQVTIACTNDDGRGQVTDKPVGILIPHDGYEEIHFPKQTEFYKFSWPLFRWLLNHVKRYDLVHIHAMFSFSSVAAAHAARLAGVPYLIRPLGVLNTWGFENRRRWLKALSFKWIESPILKHAAAMHYTSEAEKQEAEKAGATAPAQVLPLGIDVSSFGPTLDPTAFFDRFPTAQGKELVLFLSRLDEKKGLSVLLQAWALMKPNNERLLVIAGDGPAAYVAQLKSEATALGIADSILWTGHLDGELKRSAMAAAKLYTLPSYSENFGIAAVEALAAGLPCILSSGVAIAAQVQQRGGCLMVEPDAPRWADTMRSLLADSALQQRLSSEARSSAQDLFSLDAMGRALTQTYDRLLKQ
jgi:glycosyltransferase involved in cell wall biosynthesis